MKLSVVLGTYNRLNQLKRCIESIIRETSTPFMVYITDAGSTDGTIEYLRSIASQRIYPIFVGKKLGQAKAYNDVFSIVDTPFTCWLSDDNEVVENGLDRAVDILKSDANIGMVALKTKDVQGRFVGAPYIGGISTAGILNVNQGVLPTSIMKQVGGFSVEFRDYGIDPALTADVLLAGYKVVYTKKVALHHYRNWSENPSSENYKWLKERHAVATRLYDEKYGSDNAQVNKIYRVKMAAARKVKPLMAHGPMASLLRHSSFMRTCINVFSGKYISLFDPFISIGKRYHLSQQIRREN